MSDAELTPPVGPDDHAVGPEDAPVTLVEYGDYQCPYCGEAYLTVQQVQHELGSRLRFVFRNFPLRNAHPFAEGAAEAAEAAGAQGKFWEMHDTLYENQRALGADDLVGYAEAIGLDVERFADDLEAGTYGPRVRGDFRSGVRSGVNGTPTFFVNGRRYDGPWSDAAAFARALRDVAVAEPRR